jgi:hypothetical protein
MCGIARTTISPQLRQFTLTLYDLSDGRLTDFLADS